MLVRGWFTQSSEILWAKWFQFPRETTDDIWVWRYNSDTDRSSLVRNTHFLPWAASFEAKCSNKKRAAGWWRRLLFFRLPSGGDVPKDDGWTSQSTHFRTFKTSARTLFCFTAQKWKNEENPKMPKCSKDRKKPNLIIPESTAVQTYEYGDHICH